MKFLGVVPGEVSDECREVEGHNDHTEEARPEANVQSKVHVVHLKKKQQDWLRQVSRF